MARYISPAEFWAQIDSLKPFSDQEIKMISKELAEPRNLGLDSRSFDIGSMEDGDYKLDSYGLGKLIYFLETLRDSGDGSVKVDCDYERDYDGGTRRLISFSRERDINKFSVNAGISLQRQILTGRKWVEEDRKKKEAADALQAAIEEIVRDFKDDKMTLDEFQRKIKELQIS